NGRKIYKGTTSNWNTGSNIQSTLVANGYSSTDMTDLYNWYIQWGNDLVIGENPAETIGAWTGWAYWVYPTSGASASSTGPSRAVEMRVIRRKKRRRLKSVEAMRSTQSVFLTAPSTLPQTI
ncbi:MAG: hypothetical protein HC888_05460, partial [Candidatus Competibacteraceae bacterium]|nr:hypothetical protein [Candidatus Competibacteraceae bacterium]